MIISFLNLKIKRPLYQYASRLIKPSVLNKNNKFLSLLSFFSPPLAFNNLN